VPLTTLVSARPVRVLTVALFIFFNILSLAILASSRAAKSKVSYFSRGAFTTTPSPITTFIMTPQITRWADFAYVSEIFDSEAHEFQYTMFAVIDSNDVIYYRKLPTRKAEISF
jgi:hypothetical protein